MFTDDLTVCGVYRCSINCGRVATAISACGGHCVFCCLFDGMGTLCRYVLSREWSFYERTMHHFGHMIVAVLPYMLMPMTAAIFSSLAGNNDLR